MVESTAETNAGENASTRKAREILVALARAGVRDVVIAPGSRNAPLAYALAGAEKAGWMRARVVVDERSASFIALGIAHTRPAAVVTTSGTAVANLHPAVLEADQSGLPLIVLSADRPHELRGIGANQTGDQVKIFTGAVRQFWELPASSEYPAAMIRTAITRAAAAARGIRTGRPGPVHLNVAFAAPLTPAATWHAENAGLSAATWHGAQNPSKAATSVDAIPAATVAGTDVRASAEPAPARLPRGPRTVVIAGNRSHIAPEVADSWHYPILAEPASGLRGAAHAVVGGALILGKPEFADPIERAIVIGKPTLSRSVNALLRRDGVEVVSIAGGGNWFDISAAASLVCDAISIDEPATLADEGFLADWLGAGAAIDAVAIAHGSAALDGTSAARAVLEAPGAAVVIGASMAIREADLYGPAGPALAAGPLYANRGLGGIDGTIATAIGVALTQGPTRALLGDLTFQHDFGSLIAGRDEQQVDLQIVLLDDDGGTIFATLEHGQEEYSGVFSRFFRTPQRRDIAELVRGAGARYQPIETMAELRRELNRAPSGISVLHIRYDGDTARSRNLLLRSRVGQALD